MFPQYFAVSHTGNIVSSVQFLFQDADYTKATRQRILTKIRACEHSSKFGEQFELRQNFASTFKLEGTFLYPYRGVRHFGYPHAKPSWGFRVLTCWSNEKVYTSYWALLKYETEQQIKGNSTFVSLKLEHIFFYIYRDNLTRWSAVLSVFQICILDCGILYFVDWTGLVKRGLVKCGLVKCGLVKRGLLKRRLVKCRLVKRRLVKRRLVKRGLVKCRLVKRGLVKRGPVKIKWKNVI